MKSSLNFLVHTILTLAMAHGFRIYNQNLVKEPQKYQLQAPVSDSLQDTYKWDRRTYGYGLPEVLNPPQMYDFHEKEHRQYPKEISRSPSNVYNFFGPEYDIRGYPPRNVFEYPTHPLVIGPQGETWPARDSKNLSQDRWAFLNPDTDRIKARFPFSPPASLPDLTPSPLSQMKTQSCINTCPSTSEYNPVCGTNGVTYENPGKLECAKYCGVDVTLQRQSPCNQATNTEPPTVTTKPTTSPPPPIFVGNEETSNPLTDLLIFATTESPDSSGEDFDIDIRSRNLNLEDAAIVFEE